MSRPVANRAGLFYCPKLAVIKIHSFSTGFNVTELLNS